MPVELTKDSEFVGRFLAAEQILRSAVLRCLTDPTFAGKFESDDTVEKHFAVANNMGTARNDKGDL
jgi:hypothetical protein